MSQGSRAASSGMSGKNEKILFWGCFMALIATAFSFVVRTQVMDQWALKFALSKTQQGEINGVGLWPFALSIILFSMLIDRIGYGKAMVFAFICHVTSAITIISARGYTMLYIGTFIGALGNGTVEAVINPVVATMFSREKTKWLNILHAGWPGGLVIGGLLAIIMGKDFDWQFKVALLFIPTVLYALLMIGRKFPVNERVAAGVSYRDMLREVGFIGALIALTLMCSEVGRFFGVDYRISLGVALVLATLFGIYTRALGQPMFLFLVLVMIPLATTELGTDSWITDLLEPVMTSIKLNAGWVLVYTSFIMMILRFFAGPIVHTLSPLGLLAVSSAIAAVGLVALSRAEGIFILGAATLYGFGKTFFWPTMLGVVAERFPRGGAMTLNTISAIGMLGVGVVGSAFLGNIQDTRIETALAAEDSSLHAELVSAEPSKSVFGEYKALDPKKVAELNDKYDLAKARLDFIEKEKEAGKPTSGLDFDDALAKNKDYELLVRRAYDDVIREKTDTRDIPYSEMERKLEEKGMFIPDSQYATIEKDAKELKSVSNAAKKGALTTVAIFPCIMLVCYLGLIFYFKSKGGYVAEHLTGHDVEDAKFTGGVAGAVE